MAKPAGNELPNTENIVLSVKLDIKNKEETIMIGEFESVKQYLNRGTYSDLIYFKKRDIGLLLQDFVLISNELADIKVILLDSTRRKKSDKFQWAKDRLKDYIYSENPIYAFTALKLWQEYRKSLTEKTLSENLLNVFDDITFPLRFNMLEEIKRRQEINKDNPIEYLDYDFRKYSVEIYYDFSDKTREYAITDTSTAALLTYYLKNIYNNNRYIQVCPLCDNAFIAKTMGMKTFCSEKCKRESIRLNKKRFDDRAKGLTFERAHKNGYMYWYNKIAKLRKSDIPKAELSKIEKTFQEFCDESNERKQLVKRGKKNASDYENWLIDKRKDIDMIMEKMQ